MNRKMKLTSNTAGNWAYKQRFEEAGLTAILGCGFDPGVSGIYTAYAAKHHFDEMHYLDIVDCNAGNHHKAFATNFNPEINIREITQNGRYYEDGKWVTTKPLEFHKDLTYPNIGPRDSYLLYHEELESLVKNFPTIKRARFWMTFGQEYLTHLRVIQNIGMARIDEIDYNGVKIVPLQFLKAVLPNPQDLGENYEGETSIGCRIRGVKDGKERTYYVYNNCSHQEAYKETRHAGCQLYYRCTCHDRCHDVLERTLEETGSMECRRDLIRTRSWNSSISRVCLGTKYWTETWNFQKTGMEYERRRQRPPKYWV